MKYCLIALVVVLILFHQYAGYWADDRLVFGFLPIGLAYHVGISLAAGGIWFLATVLVWPPEVVVEATASSPTESGSAETR